LVTLAILFVAFLFLTGAGAAFLVGLSRHPATTTTAAATQNLPALTETEIEQARSETHDHSSRLLHLALSAVLISMCRQPKSGPNETR
jgi:hypothetical protein